MTTSAVPYAAGTRAGLRIRQPVTSALVATLIATTAFLDAHRGYVALIVAWTSTNVHNLALHPVAAMLASIFITPGYPLVNVLLVAVGCAIAERMLGARAVVLIALAGHVVATLVTEYGAALAAHLHLIVASSPYRSDVGVSYVMFTLLGAAAMVLPARFRRPALAILVLAVLRSVVAAPGMTTARHALSLACGVIAVRCIYTTRAERAEAAASMSSDHVALGRGVARIRERTDRLAIL